MNNFIIIKCPTKPSVNQCKQNPWSYLKLNIWSSEKYLIGLTQTFFDYTYSFNSIKMLKIYNNSKQVIK